MEKQIEIDRKALPLDVRDLPEHQLRALYALFGDTLYTQNASLIVRMQLNTWNICAITALLGDEPSQRKVLELSVRFSEAGIDPSPEFKRAAIASLKNALNTNKLPSSKRRGGQGKGSDGAQFKLAVDYWKEVFLRGERGANKRVAGLRSPKFVSEAVSRFGDAAKGYALIGMALRDESGPNLTWFSELKKFTDQLGRDTGATRRFRDAAG